IDWLGDCLCRVARRPLPDGVYRDRAGEVRLIDHAVTFRSLLKTAIDKIRQSARGMPAIFIRLLENLHRIWLVTSDDTVRDEVTRPAELIMRASHESVPEESDRIDVRVAYDALRNTAPIGRPLLGPAGTTRGPTRLTDVPEAPG